MGTPHRPLPVKLIAGFIYADQEVFEKTKSVLRRTFGPMDYESERLRFDQTAYYEKEMGPGLSRAFTSFTRLVPADKLAGIKLTANGIEKKFMTPDGRRTVNVDPGYVSLSKLVLATTKSFVHRIYVGRGIFEEVTLYFKDGGFQPGRWTYPDFRNPEHLAVFNKIRESYMAQLVKTYDSSQLYRCV